MKATFLLSKDPSFESTGDMTMASLVMSLASQAMSVNVICLSGRPHSREDGHVRVAKPAPKPTSLVINSVRRRQSLVHTRFALPELTRALDACDTDMVVADHSYMAEAVMASRRYRPSEVLAVNTVVPEALVWKATRGVVGRLDARRIVRDEIKIARNARTLATYDRSETEFYQSLGIRRSHWLDLTLPPRAQIPVSDTDRRLVFVGDRRWGPNQEAFELILRWWPQISAGIAGAELFIVGAADPAAPTPSLPDGVTDVGFVDDLDGFLATCRALLAPIQTGGGVRVKILDAASRGLPVVGTTAAVGSLSEVLGVHVFDDKDRFIAQARQYLANKADATSAGDALYERNHSRWTDEVPHRSVARWLT
ncbi:glycosyltransferase [Williamsia sp. CHRR-6]|uniref:glycosyltransferase n=1 Tax=Williamsia sp. CHRR-6 TaxID=2835871 RepID=UPI001BDA9BCC|nr:glycosyltransferase [Williamsia sp. CHRR-6]MBT0565932.1 glycosyltransferase [Williamsia sp. CHRR-6]